MSSAYESSYISLRLTKDIKGLPLWVKQVIYLDLHQELAEHFSVETLYHMTIEDAVAFFIPHITDEGQRILMELKGDLGKLLFDASRKYTVLDMCLHHEWTLEACCHYLMEAIQSNWVHPPTSIKALGTVEYLANRIRLGEYLVKLGRINAEQLDQALRTQQYIKEALHEHTGIANILINLGYITRQDTEGILFLKEESAKTIEKVAFFEKLL